MSQICLEDLLFCFQVAHMPAAKQQIFNCHIHTCSS